jgi:hypothetical protein
MISLWSSVVNGTSRGKRGKGEKKVSRSELDSNEETD